MYEEPLSFDEDSVHYLEYYCVDQLGNTEVVQNETDKVDMTPPNTTKIIMGCHTPCLPEEECDYWVNSDTMFGFVAEDGGPICAVGVDETLYQKDGRRWIEYNPDHNVSFLMQGYHELCYYSVDELGNVEETQCEIDVVDNGPPRGWVQNPVTGRYYHDGETFTVMAPAIDFGNPASGVDVCHFQAIDIHFEDLSDEEIIEVQLMMKFNHEMYELLDYLDGRYTLVDLGTVPYDGRYCTGTVTIPEESGITDKAYLVIRVTDRSCNEYYDLAREFVDGFIFGDTILMDFDNQGPYVVITDNGGLEGTVEGGYHFTVYASVEEYDSGADECWGELYYKQPVCEMAEVCWEEEVCEMLPEEGYDICMGECEGDPQCESYCEMDYMAPNCWDEEVCEEQEVCEDYELVFLEQYMGVMLSDDECRIVGDLPDENEDGNYRFTATARDEEFNLGSDSVDFTMDSMPPVKTVYSPIEGQMFGPEGIPIKIGMSDASGVAEETVQYRVYEPGVDLDAIFGSGGLYDSGWTGTVLTEGNMLEGNYTDVFDVVGAGLASGSYFMRVRGCDVLYDAPLPEGSEIPPHCTDPVMTILIDLDPPVGPSGVVKDGDVITWNAATDALSGVSHYNIYCDGEKVDETTELTYTTDGTDCEYKVSAEDNVGNEGTRRTPSTPGDVPPVDPGPGSGPGTTPAWTPSSGSGGSSSSGSSGSSNNNGDTGPVCQTLGQVCSVDGDCCEGTCSDNVCAIVQEDTGAAKDVVDILAPEYADVGVLVTVRAQYRSDGSPLAGAELHIMMPNNEVMQRTTDANGEVKYSTQQEGWYKYDVPGYEKGSVVYTYAGVKEVYTGEDTGGEAAPGDDGEVKVQTTTGLLFGVLAPELAGLIVLLALVAGYLGYRRYSNRGE